MFSFPNWKRGDNSVPSNRRPIPIVKQCFRILLLFIYNNCIIIILSIRLVENWQLATFKFFEMFENPDQLEYIDFFILFQREITHFVHGAPESFRIPYTCAAHKNEKYLESMWKCGKSAH